MTTPTRSFMSKIKALWKSMTCQDLSEKIAEAKRLDDEAKAQLAAAPKEKLKAAIEKNRDSLIPVASVLALLLTGCSALGISTSALDKQAAAQNAENVRQITTENEAYLAAEEKADSLKQVQRDRNKAALDLAAKMAEAAK